jgi:hypothetical protein
MEDILWDSRGYPLGKRVALVGEAAHTMPPFFNGQVHSDCHFFSRDEEQETSHTLCRTLDKLWKMVKFWPIH